MAVEIDRKLLLEHQWLESEYFACDDSSLIVGVCASGAFEEAGARHLAALGDMAARHVLGYGCDTGGTTRCWPSCVSWSILPKSIAK